MYKLKFYSKSIFEHFFVPDSFYRTKLKNTFNKIKSKPSSPILDRVNYYFPSQKLFEFSNDFVRMDQLSCRDNTSYFYDLKSVLRYFPSNYRFQYFFGDITTVPNSPTFVKCRPILEANQNSAILKLNSVRHYRKIRDNLCYSEKIDKLVWRGASYNKVRDNFVLRYYDHPLCDVAITKGKSEILGEKYQKPFMSIKDQLKYKFILSLEGNDVATNLKWIAQSNSLCFMRRPSFESWFMEGSLIPDFHYVLVDSNFDNIKRKLIIIWIILMKQKL